MNPRQWKKACKKAAAEIERRWPGECIFTPSDGTDTVYAPPGYAPRYRGPRWYQRVSRRFAYPLKGTPLLISQDYWGEVDIQTPIEVLKYRDAIENFDWEKAMETVVRGLTSHKVNFANNMLEVLVLDEPAASGANHHYSIRVPRDVEHGIPGTRFDLIFQNGPIAQGINGITHEVLLAILIDRLQGFERGPFANPWNTAAIEHLKDAAKVLRIRTEQRQARGVEGTHTV